MRAFLFVQTASRMPESRSGHRVLRRYCSKIGGQPSFPATAYALCVRCSRVPLPEAHPVRIANYHRRSLNVNIKSRRQGALHNSTKMEM